MASRKSKKFQMSGAILLAKAGGYDAAGGETGIAYIFQNAGHAEEYRKHKAKRPDLFKIINVSIIEKV